MSRYDPLPRLSTLPRAQILTWSMAHREREHAACLGQIRDCTEFSQQMGWGNRRGRPRCGAIGLKWKDGLLVPKEQRMWESDQ